MTIVKKQYAPRTRIHPKIDPASGRTHQSFKDSCDINNLVDHWMRTGVADFTPRKAMFADVSEIPDFHQTKNLVAFAEQQFALLAPEEREKFSGPLAYLEELYEAESSLASEPGTDDSLVVTVPSDTKPPQTSQKGDENETQITS